MPVFLSLVHLSMPRQLYPFHEPHQIPLFPQRYYLHNIHLLPQGISISLGINVTGYNHMPHFLAFQTKKKAELFLKEKIDLITDLSKAKII
jgi:hypothetical protein